MNEQQIIEGAVVPLPQAPMTLYGTDDPQEIIERATAQAVVLAKVVNDRKLYTNISGRKHVRIEGWTTLGSLTGVFAVPVWTRPVADGWEARVEARTMSGALVGAAEAECLRTERTWSTRDDYALRSMAQTRAASKALRLPLGFIMQLAGFDPTPAEEIPDNAAEEPQPLRPRGGVERPDPRPSARPIGGGTGITQFWKSAKAMGYEAPEVLKIAGGSVAGWTDEQLDGLMAELKDRKGVPA